jgi:hypothetical protein
LIDARLQRLKLEGTPRVKREKRMPAPPLSPIPITDNYTDFMVPPAGPGPVTPGDGVGDVDYGTLAQRMMHDIFAAGGLQAQDEDEKEREGHGRRSKVNGEDRFERLRSPISPSPVNGELEDLSGGHEADGTTSMKLENEDTHASSMLADLRIRGTSDDGELETTLRESEGTPEIDIGAIRFANDYDESDYEDDEGDTTIGGARS